MSKNKSVPEWLPDWRDESQYPDKKSEPKQWAWEFLRRNPQYQSIVKETHEAVSLIYRPELNPGFHEWELNNYKLNALQAAASRFNVSTLVDPSVNDPFYSDPFHMFDFLHLVSLRMSKTFSEVSRPTAVNGGEEEKEYDRYKKVDEIKIETTATQVAMVFDLSLPLNDQMKQAESWLKGVQQYVKVEKRAKPRFNQLKLYLRILDAKFLGTSNNDIASLLFPNIENVYPDFSVMTE